MGNTMSGASAENANDEKAIVEKAIETLAERFSEYDWTLYDVPGTGGTEKTWHWLGDDDEDVIVCVFQGTHLHEEFHRQDFFFFNYAYRGSYNALSQRRGNMTTILEGEMCAGQPYTGYALRPDGETECVIVGVLVRKELFFRTFLPMLTRSSRLLDFFLGPEDDVFSNKFLHLRAAPEYPYRTIIELLAVEYASGRYGSQGVMRSLALALTSYAMQQYEMDYPRDASEGPIGEIVSYIEAHSDSATLVGTAEEFSYHPNYLSALIKRETGKTFSQIQLEQRMKRAGMLICNTTLSVEDIASMVGYSSSSNFYKAFRGYFGCTPREYANAR
ncbi:MAG: helix-turn-helix transcriptional regulator [Coriobacteriales bacterium]